jgi:hypothetical protein
MNPGNMETYHRSKSKSSVPTKLPTVQASNNALNKSTNEDHKKGKVNILENDEENLNSWIANQKEFLGEVE